MSIACADSKREEVGWREAEVGYESTSLMWEPGVAVSVLIELVTWRDSATSPRVLKGTTGGRKKARRQPDYTLSCAGERMSRRSKCVVSVFAGA